MLVCICNGVSDKDIDGALAGGVSTYQELRSSLSIGSNCGQCASFAKEMFSRKIAQAQSLHNMQLAYEVRA